MNKLFTLVMVCAFFAFTSSSYVSATNPPTCNNITDAGEIGGEEYQCGPFDPSVITNVASASGGSGSIEYIWLQNSVPELNGHSVVPGATGATYDPGPITQTTYYRRCARRSGCPNFTGETNWICKVVGTTPSCPNGNIQTGYANTVTYNNGVDYSGNITGAPDGNVAKFWDNNDKLTVNLDQAIVPAGTEICIKWKSRSYSSTYSGISTLKIYEIDAANNTYFLGTVTTDIKDDFVYSCITTSRDIVKLKLKNPGNLPDFDVDAITFCYCDNVIPPCPTVQNLISWPVDTCAAFSGSTDYSEFTGNIAPGSSCNTFTLSTLYRQSGGHSCNSGIPGGDGFGFCVGSFSTGNFVSNSAYAVRFSFTAGANDLGTLTSLCFYELANTPVYQNGVSNPINNNYPTKFGVRVVKNGSEIYLATGFGTSSSWMLRTINFPVSANFDYSNGDVFEFELLAYDPVGNGCSNKIWDLDEISLKGCCNQVCNANLSASVTDVDCHGDASGSIDLTVTGIPAPISYSWSNGATSEDISGLSAGTYSVIVSNPTGCADTLTGIIVTEPTMLTATCGSTPSSCNGGSDGSASVVGGGGTPPYTYAWSTGQSTAIISGLSAGVYSATVTDANNCSSTCSTIVSDAINIVLTCTGTDVSCNGGTDGTAMVNAIGGTGGFTYLWSNGASTSSISGLTAGTYTVTVTDANQCQKICSSVVGEPTALSITCSATDETCLGDIDGTASVVATGGTPPYSYSWNNGVYTASISSLSPGTYTVTVTDANGCVMTCTATVAAGAQVLATCSSTDVSCFNGSDGSAEVSVSGGTAPYTYVWNNAGTDASISGLSAGVYTVTVTDANGCSASCSTSVAQPSSDVTSSAIVNNVSCNGGADGTVDLTASGGTPPYTYCWTGINSSAAIRINAGASNDYTAVNADVFSADAYFMNGIAFSNFAAIPISNTNDDSLYLSERYGGNDVKYDIPVANGQYEVVLHFAEIYWDVQVPGGVGDRVFCMIVEGDTVLHDFDMLAIAPAKTAIVRSFFVDVTDGVVNLMFKAIVDQAKVSAIEVLPVVKTEDLANLGAGTYNVLVTDANGCTTTNTVTIAEPSAISISATALPETCLGLVDGSIDLSVSGGTPPYSYLWSNGMMTQDLANLSAGTYTVIVSDSNNCSDTLDVIVMANDSACASIGNFVWYDIDQDGLQDGDEPGIAGIIVELSDCSGNVIATDTTDSNGIYLFDNLLPGDYKITFNSGSIPTGFVFTNANQGLNDSIDSDANASNGMAICTTLDPGEDDLTWDAGLYDPVNVGDYVWYDLDQDGIQDSTELGVSDVIVQLIGPGPDGIFHTLDDVVLGTDTTDANGLYLFEDVAPGGYCIQFNAGTFPAGFVATQQDAGADNAVDSDIDALGKTASFSVTAGQADDLTWDAGIYDPVNVGDFVWNDLDQDGIQDPGEPGVSGVIVQLIGPGPDGIFHTADDIIVDSDTTDVNGEYLFVDVAPGDYCIQFDASTFPAGFVTTLQDQGFDNGVDSDIDNAGKTAAFTVTAGQADDLTWDAGIYNCGVLITEIVSDVTCNGASDGSINVTASNGIAPYTFVWSTGATTEDLFGLSAGTYTVTVTDDNSCAATKVITINEPTKLSASCSSTDATCNGAADGTATASANGGTPPYTYSWSDGQFTATAVGLNAGTYSVIVTDANQCTDTCFATVSEASKVMPVCSVDSNVSCFGASDGVASVSVSGGTPGYTYVWDDGTTTSTNSGLSAGTYVVTVYDLNQCADSCTVTITEPAPLQIGGTVTPVTCKGGSDGSIDLVVSGGTAPYMYVWSNGETTMDIDSLTTGVYSVVVTDINGCSTTSSNFTIAEPSAVLATCAVISDVLCNGGSNGVASVNATGGIGSITYLWSTGETTQVISNLSAGPYTATATDSKGCTGVCSVTVNEPPVLTVTCSATAASCNGGNDGTASVTANGGTPPYSYVWNNGQLTSTAIGLAAGTYTVIVTDANQCTDTCTATVNEATMLMLTCTTDSNVSCFGASDGVASVTVSGGTPGYSYLWNDGTTTATNSGLTKGTYKVTVIDANQCTGSCTVTITQPAPLQSGGTVTPVSCNGGSDGAISIVVIGGTTPYMYAWSNGATTMSIDSLSTGIYSVVVTDANGCTTTSSNFTIYEPPAVTPTCVLVSDVVCNGESNGVASVSATGGTGTITYLWSTGASTQVISGLAAGTYSVKATDSKGCTGVCSVTVVEPPPLVVVAAANSPACLDSLLQLNASGADNYSWSGPNGFNSLMQNPSINAAQPANEGWYVVVGTDTNGCVGVDSVFVTIVTNCVCPTLNIFVQQTGVSCNGGADAVVNLIVSGGQAPYSYLWSNGISTNPAFGFAAGSYTVTITDNYQCDTVLTVWIAEPAQLSGSVTKTDVTCNGAADGTITAIPSGGTSPYTYQWSTIPQQTNATATGLGPGFYSVLVTDSNNCSTVLVASIFEPSLLNVAVNNIDLTCYGDSNATATALPFGGTAGYTYLWNDGQTTAIATGLSAGSYSVTVTDANGCTTIGNTFVVQPSAITCLPEVIDASCFGGSDGKIIVNAMGGIPPYNYLWNTVPAQTSSSIINLSAGNYAVTIIDSAGCSVTKMFTVDEPADLIATLTPTMPLCAGGNNGSINASVSGGTPPYSFIWNDGQTSSTATGLSAGTYTITVTDSLNCTEVQTVILNDPSALTCNPLVNHVLCNGSSTGSIILNASGGTPPYSYSWSNGDTTDIASGLSAGPYSVTVTDANGCSKIQNFLVTEPVELTCLCNAVIQNVSCKAGSDGSATVIAQGGTPPYSYLWSTGAITAMVNNLSAGNYTVTITDANGCIKVNVITITEPTQLNATIASTDVSCNAGNDGTASVNVSGGTPPYTYAWNTNPVQTNSVATGLMAGTYLVTITDANSCTLTRTVQVNEPGAITCSISSTDATCNGYANGIAMLSAGGGTAPYTYLWSNGSTGAVVTGLVAGTYTVVITDAKACVDSCTTVINEPNALLPLWTQVDPSCVGASDGSIDLSVTGGTPPYTYLWSNNATSEDIAGLSAGIYKVTITDANGCVTIGCVILVDPPALVCNTTMTPETCNGSSDGTATALVSGGTPPYTYFWSDGQITPVASGLMGGIYNVTVTDSKGCVSVCTVQVTIASFVSCVPVASDVKCFGANNGTAAVNAVSGGTAPYSYLWSNGATTSFISNLGPGIYTVTVTDVNGCSDVKSVTVSEPTALGCIVTAIDITCDLESGAAYVHVSGGTPPYIYLWNNGATTDSIVALTAGYYEVLVTDGNGCTTICSATVGGNILSACPPSSTPVSCNNGNNGTATACATIGGLPPYSYLWSDGQITATAIGLAAGTYTVTVTDANACTVSSSVVVTEPMALSCAINTTPAQCGLNNGSAIVNTTGGTAPYAYLWSDNSTSAINNNLAAGIYSVTVTDANGCVNVCQDTIFEIPLLNFDLLTSDVSCNGAADGSMTIVNLSGGTSPFTYLWSNSATSSSISNLGPGVYSVIVTDANGCQVSKSDSINEEPALSCLATILTQPSCIGFDGSATVVASGGVGSYTFAWNTVPVQTSATATGLNGGTYTVTVTDAANCSSTCSVTLVNPGGHSISLSPSVFGNYNIRCNGSTTGTVDLTVTGALGPVSYLWSNGVTTEDLMMLGAGTYTVTVTYNGCDVVDSVTLIEPPVLSSSTAVTQTNLCSGDSMAIVSVTVNGGTAPYNYMWNTSPVQNTASATGLSAGTYIVMISDMFGCVASDTVDVIDPVLLTASCQGTDATCNGGTDGSVNLTVAGGTAPYTYAWSNATSTEDLQNVGAGVYTVTVSDVNGCLITCQATVGEPSAIVIATSLTDVTCAGLSDGSIDITVTGGAMPYTFSWSNGATTEDINSIAAGTYMVTVTDDNGCIEQLSNIIVNEPAALMISGTSVTNITCFGAQTGAIDVTITGGTSPYSYLWSNNDTTEDLNGVAAGTYSVVVTDANNCTITSSSITISQPSMLMINSSVTHIDCAGDSSGAINITAYGGTAPYTYLWSTGSTMEDISGLTAGNYTVTVKDGNLCSMMAVIMVTEPLSLMITSTPVNNATCYDGADGSASVNVTGGASPYMYLWANGQTTQTATGLSRGTYPVTITDNNGCVISDTSSIIVGSPDPLLIGYTDSISICNITTDMNSFVHGEIVTTQWPGAIISATAGGTGADAVIIFDSDVTGTGDPDLEVGIGPLFTIPENVTDTNSDGLVDYPDDNQFGGTMVFDFFEPVNINSFTFVDQDINTLPTVIAYDSTGAVITTVLVPNMGDGSTQIVSLNAVNVSKLEIFSITSFAVTQFDIDCGVIQGGCVNGSIDLNVGGGVPAYTYLWSNGATTEDLVGVPCAVYTVTVTDANNCSMSRTIDLTPNLVPITCIVTPQIAGPCTANSGSATVVSVSGGVSPYTYSWSTNPVQYGVTATGLAAGAYAVLITDANGCTVVDNVTVVDAAPMTNSVITSAVSCFGGSDGSFVPTISGGTPPYTYLWQDGSVAPARYNISRGTYIVTVTDANGCTMMIARWINSPTKLNLLSTAVVPASCNGAYDGVFTTNTFGGTPPYSYLWSDGATVADRYDLGRGVHTVTVTDANGCSTQIIRWINSPAALRAYSGQVSAATCASSNDGVFTTNIIGGTPPYTYLWTDGGTTQHRTDLSRGVWGVTVTDANGCDVYISRWINSPTPIVSVAANVSPASCYTSNDGVFTTNTWGGTPPYSYLWSDGGTSEDRYDLPRGVHTVLITDAAGCTKQMVQWIGSPVNVTVSTSSNSPSQANASDGDASVIPNTGVAPFTYAWSNGQQTQTATGLSQGWYSVTVTDNNGCSTMAWVQVSYGTSSRILVDAEEMEYSLYPNPNSGYFTLEIISPSELKQATFTLINIIGEQINTETRSISLGVNTIDYDVTHLNAGIYFLRIQSDGVVKTIRVVKD